MLATWSVGATVVLPAPDAPLDGAPLDVAVVHTGSPSAPDAADVVAVPRSPLAMPDGPGPAGALEFAVEIRAQGDRFLAGPGPAPTWRRSRRATSGCRTTSSPGSPTSTADERPCRRRPARQHRAVRLARGVRFGLLVPLVARAGVLLCPPDVLDEDLLAAEHVTWRADGTGLRRS
jgi:hypothetical protein